MNEHTIYYHFRYAGPFGKLAVGANKLEPVLQFTPIKNPHSNGGVTIAVRESGDNLFFGVAKCALSDTYSKSYGRVRAEGISRSAKSLRTEKMDKDDITKTAVELAQLVGSRFSLEDAVSQLA
jgi:hypothetical protein